MLSSGHCKNRQEAGLGLEDLELMAAKTVQADMLFMGAMGGSTMGLVWPHPEGNGNESPWACGSLGATKEDHNFHVKIDTMPFMLIMDMVKFRYKSWSSYCGVHSKIL